MPEKSTLARARRDRRQGKASTTQAGEFVREEFHHVRQGRHGARSSKQAIAIGLSKARRAGVDVKPPGRGQASERTRHKAQQDLARGHGGRSAGPRHRASPRRARASTTALRREGHAAASHTAIARQSRSAAARRRTGSSRATGSARGRAAGSARGRATGRKTSARRGRRAAAAR